MGDAILESKDIAVSDLAEQSIEVNYETVQTRAFKKRISQHLQKSSM